jgi:hypothetical protein
LTIKLPGQRKEQWEVVGIFRFVDMLGDPMAYANFDFIASQMHLPKQTASYRIITASHDSAFQKELTQRIDNYLTDRNFSVQSIQSGYLLRANATQAVTPWSSSY